MDTAQAGVPAGVGVPGTTWAPRPPPPVRSAASKHDAPPYTLSSLVSIARPNPFFQSISIINIDTIGLYQYPFSGLIQW